VSVGSGAVGRSPGRDARYVGCPQRGYPGWCRALVVSRSPFDLLVGPVGRLP